MRTETLLAIAALTIWLVWSFGPLLPFVVIEHWLHSGEFRRAVWGVRATRRFHGSFAWQFDDAEVCALACLGLTRTALNREPAVADGVFKYLLINSQVNLMITAGRYREALKLADIPADEKDLPIELGALINLNAAEALYNLGRWDEAWRRLEQLDTKCDAMASAGMLNQRCWIMAHTGRSEEALKIHAQIFRNALPRIFRAEHHFTKAVVLLGLGKFEDAITEADLGQSLSARASSKRNARFLLARIEMARGNVAKAEMLFREGSHHRYQGQGGDGLLAWGDCLVKLGKGEEARRAWELCVKRDPQSAASAHAQERLIQALAPLLPVDPLPSSCPQLER